MLTIQICLFLNTLHIQFNDEFEAIKLWAINNKMIINNAKNKELVSHRPDRIDYS